MDDKGQVFTLLKAYESVLDADGRPPLNVNFIIEGEEECGGDVIVDRLKLEPERTRADAVLVADMGVLRARASRRCTRRSAACATPRSTSGRSSGTSIRAPTAAWRPTRSRRSAGC